jgi:hypothetical protein
MIDCPDTNRLVDSLEEETLDLELMAHLRECASCRMELRIIRAIPQAMKARGPVPEYLVRRTMLAISAAADPPAREMPTPLHVVSAGVLGAITAAVAVIGTGAVEGAGIGEVAAFSAFFGLAAAIVEAVLAPGLEARTG